MEFFFPIMYVFKREILIHDKTDYQGGKWLSFAKPLAWGWFLLYNIFNCPPEAHAAHQKLTAMKLLDYRNFDLVLSLHIPMET